MSRTVKGSKGPGFEYWGKRAHSGHYPPGKKAKQHTHQVERQQNKKLSKHEL